MLFMTAAERKRLCHFDIHPAFTTEPYDQSKNVFVKQMRQFEGMYSHSGKLIASLKQNLYWSRTERYIYLKGIARRLNEHNIFASDADPCLFINARNAGHTYIAVTVNDFLVSSNTAAQAGRCSPQHTLPKVQCERYGTTEHGPGLGYQIKWARTHSRITAYINRKAYHHREDRQRIKNKTSLPKNRDFDEEGGAHC